MPDLGKYGDTVMTAYAASVVLLVLLVGLSLWRGRKVRSDLARVEQRQRRDG